MGSDGALSINLERSSGRTSQYQRGHESVEILWARLDSTRQKGPLLPQITTDLSRSAGDVVKDSLTGKYHVPRTMWRMARATRKLSKAAQELGRRGGQTRAKKLSRKRRVEIARKAIAARWAKAAQARPKKHR